MSHRLERLLIWLLATVAGAGSLYGALTAPKDTASIVLGVFIVLGVASAAVGILGFAIEVVNFVNRLLPDAPNTATYQRVVDRPPGLPEGETPTRVLSPEPISDVRPRVQSQPIGEKGRVFVDVTHEYLIGLFKDKLGIQANKLIAPYIGKWMSVSGKLGDVLGDQLLQVTFASVKVNEYLYMYFDKSWRDRLAVLQPGQIIHVIGRIDTVDTVSVALRDCELLRVLPYSTHADTEGNEPQEPTAGPEAKPYSDLKP